MTVGRRERESGNERGELIVEWGPRGFLAGLNIIENQRVWRWGRKSKRGKREKTKILG